MNLEDIQKIAGNVAVLPRLIAALRDAPSGASILVGPQLGSLIGFPPISEFLNDLARRSGLTESGDRAIDLLLEATGQAYLHDALETTYGSHRLPENLEGPLALLPLLRPGRFVTFSIDQALQHAWLKSDPSGINVVLGPELPPVPGPRCLHQLFGDVYSEHSLILREADRARVLEQVGPRLFGESETVLLIVGLPPGEFTRKSSPIQEALLRALRQSRGRQFAILSPPPQKELEEVAAQLYRANLRPIWCPDNGLETLLRHLIKEVHPETLLPDPSEPSATNAVVPARGLATPPDLPPLAVPDDLLQALNRGEAVAFVGAGLAARAQLPTWHQLVDLMLDWAVSEKLLPPERAQIQRAAMADGEVNAVADNATNAFARAPGALERRLSEVFARDVPIPRSFTLLRQIPFAGLLTSNFDRFLDRVYSGSEYDVQLTPRDGEKLAEYASSGRKFVLKVYGDLQRPETVILAPAEYQSLIASNAAFSRFIENLFFSRTLLFLGVSLDGLADYLRSFSFPSGLNRRHFALIAVRGSSWQAQAELLLRRYNITVIPIPVSKEYPEVDQFLEMIVAHTGTRTAVAAPSESPASESRLQRVILKNIGPFKELDLEFNGRWKILLGDNGVGKSTILKAIAVALVGSDARHYAARLLRGGETLGSVTLITDRNPSGYVTEIQRLGAEADVISKAGLPLATEGWVALGFPPLRTVTWKPIDGMKTSGRRHATPEDLLPLVRGDVDPRMDDLKQWIVNQDSLAKNETMPAEDRERARQMLERFFTIVGVLSEGVDVAFDKVTTTYQVMVRTVDTVIPLEALSQGMTSLLSWVGILVQRLYEVRQESATPTDEFALVLMDEIDAHMHPAWQQKLIAGVKSAFPKVQVIASTHSPLIVGGMPADEVVRLIREDSVVRTMPISEDMLRGRADQLLTGDLFGLQSTLALDAPTKELLAEYKRLLGRSQRTAEEQRRYLELHRELKPRLPTSLENKPERQAQFLVTTILETDFNSESLPQLRSKLVAAAQKVAASLGRKGAE